MKNLLKILMGGLVIPFLCGNVFASGPGTTGANFLKIGVGAKAAAMGEAFTAFADDPTALYWNPAGLSQLKKMELSASYHSWFADVKQGYLSFVLPALGGILALGTNYVDMGSIEGRDDKGNLTGSFGASAIQIVAGYATGKESFSVGFAGGILQETIKTDKKSTVLGTAGILLKKDPLSLGLCAQNLGGKIGEDPPPFIMRGGVGFKRSNFRFGVDVVNPQDNDTYFCAGGEFLLGDKFALRAGYRNGQDVGSGYTVGIGFNMNWLSFDYAYVPYGDLGRTHRISVGLQF